MATAIVSKKRKSMDSEANKPSGPSAPSTEELMLAEALKVLLRLHGPPESALPADGVPHLQTTEAALVQVVEMLVKNDAKLLAGYFLRQRYEVAGCEKWKEGMAPGLAYFALGCIHGFAELVKVVLEGLWIIEAGDVRWQDHHTRHGSEVETNWRYENLGDLSEELYAKMSAKHTQQFHRLHYKVTITPGYSWLNAAKDFQVRSCAARRPCIQEYLSCQLACAD
jgi:hypothetical protein